MPNLRSAQDDTRLQDVEHDDIPEIVAPAGGSDLGAVPDSEYRTGRLREWPWSFAALSIALLIVALYASVCFHWGGPRVTLMILSLVTTVWLFAVQRPWHSKA